MSSVITDANVMKVVALDQEPSFIQNPQKYQPSARVNKNGNPIHRRRKRSAEEIAILEQRFQIGPNWDYDTFENLARQLNISKQKVYKWRWERVKREAVRMGQDPLLAQWGATLPKTLQAKQTSPFSIVFTQ